MGVAANGPHPLSDIAPKAPLVKIFRNHPWSEFAYSARCTAIEAETSWHL